MRKLKSCYICEHLVDTGKKDAGCDTCGRGEGSEIFRCKAGKWDKIYDGEVSLFEMDEEDMKEVAPNRSKATAKYTTLNTPFFFYYKDADKCPSFNEVPEGV